MTGVRLRASALLDLVLYEQPGDMTATSRETAKRYRDCIASGLYPTDSLAWAWADHAVDRNNPQPGELDRRKNHMVGGVRRLTAFGAMAQWAGMPDSRMTGTCILSGPTGSGKNVAAMYLAIHRNGAYFLGSTISDLALGESPILRGLRSVPLLVLDELGREALIGPTLSRIDTLLVHRHDNRLGTLITTNLTSVEFKARYGGHILDRAESSGGYTEVMGGSRRVRGVEPRMTSILGHCRIADLVRSVYTLTCSGRTTIPETVIDHLAAEFGITDAQISDAAAEREALLAIPAELALGPIGRALRVASGDEEPAKMRTHDPID